MSQSLKERYETTPLFGGNAPFVEYYYERFLEDPASVDPKWREYFRGFSSGANGEIAHGPIKDAFARRAREAARYGLQAAPAAAVSVDASEKQAAVSRLIQVYFLRGHQVADIDPLGLMDRHTPAVLGLDYFGLTEADMDHEFVTGEIAGHDYPMKLREILAVLKRIYCGKVGAEFAHVSRARERLWLKDRFEAAMTGSGLTHDEKMVLLTQLTAAEGIERYLHTRYVGQKRFSLEGGGSLIPVLDDLIQQGGAGGLEEVVIGMAHRGRINVLVNVLGKSPQKLFSEFEGSYDVESLRGSGDVKYHMGFSSDIRTAGGNVHVVLAFNPSHLEIVNPVVEGSVRARQHRRSDAKGQHILPVLVHGDAAFAGQGVVTETFQMSQARGFTTGGTVHIVVNNQIGFTTSDPRDARSTPYCSDVAKMIEAPVFHVNADDPEAAVLVTRLALEYRQTFGKDVVIDLVCYRRHGHNEADEPAATQPVMYKAIRNHPTVRQQYVKQLTADGLIDQPGADTLVERYREGLDEGKLITGSSLGMIGNEYTVDWSKFQDPDMDLEADTSISDKRFAELGKRLTVVPEDFETHPRVTRILVEREKMARGESLMDWGFAENLAYAALLDDGFQVRLVGQDAGRGTFFHRHAVLHNQEDNAIHVPLQHMKERQPDFTVIDSLLSEEAVLGFEYGYSTTEPNSLVIWEAQFGDFCNGAQVVIDQFISSGESKWGRICGLTLLLPHGYEGQGPEHSSARVERFLQLCAEHNIQVCVPSTPAQAFHMLRRQMLRPFRKPLIVMSPKSLLRHRMAVSEMKDLTEGGFQTLIPDVASPSVAKTKRVVFCSGKVYYDLAEARQQHGVEDVALVRIEQLYPFPIAEFAKTVKRYGKAKEIVWCQEEPQNQGAWYQIRHRLQEPLGAGHSLSYAGRAASAAPASGIFQLHAQQQKALVESALGIAED